VPETSTLPRWDPSALFPSLESRQLAAAHEAVGADVARLVALHDRHGVDETEPHEPSAEEVQAFEEVLAATNAVAADLLRLQVYVLSFVSTDSRNDTGQALFSELDRHDATMRQLSARFTAWVAALGPTALASGSALGADHAYVLDRASARAEHQMGPDEESLYAELRVSGSGAWARLHSDVTSQLLATIAGPDGTTEQVPMTTARGLATHPDAEVRRAAYDAELAAWPTVAVPLAAAMNAIKGEANTVNDRRRWSDPLDASLFANSVDRDTFEAMQQAVVDSLPDFRRFLRAKATLLGYGGGLAWWDLFAPSGAESGTVSWTRGTDIVRRAFGGYSSALATMAGRAFDERWVDAEPRPGKRSGAFCMPFFDDRSLVLMNWADGFDSVQTLAHELGHAYHNVQLTERTALQRQLPMALAETASIFCETLVVAAGLEGATDGDERLALLDVDLQGAAQVVVDIHSRFLFETEVFSRRRRRTLSVDELCEQMRDAQAEAYGDGLDLDTRHPWMWAVKPHYYSSHFYNWPYTYGLLFGLGLYACYRNDADAFRTGYDELLSTTGMADAAALGARFGIDVRDTGFWAASLDVLRGRIADYEALVADRTA
jgi:pepF/M3 family oligoendopeptidase